MEATVYLLCALVAIGVAAAGLFAARRAQEGREYDRRLSMAAASEPDVFTRRRTLAEERFERQAA